MKPFVIGLLLVALPSQALAGGGIFRLRSTCGRGICHQPVVKQAFVQPVVAYQQQAAPIVIQNNFPAANAQGSTLYGYTQPQVYNPFVVDPNTLLREAAALTSASQKLTADALGLYDRLGSDALTYAAQNDQLRARAELLRSSLPLTEGNAAALTAGSQSQSITLTPDGKGGWKVDVNSTTSGATTGNQQTAPQPHGDTPTPPVPTSAGLDVLQARCAKCHTGSNSKGDFVMFDDSGVFNPAMSNFDKEKIISVSNSGLMPPKPAAILTETELAAVITFLRQ